MNDTDSAPDDHSITDEDDLSTQMLMWLVDNGHAFDFWMEPEEDIYSATDGEAVSP